MLECFLICFACFLVGFSLAVVFFVLFPAFRSCPFYGDDDCVITNSDSCTPCPFYGTEQCSCNTLGDFDIL